ncbi:MAG: helicase-exonuclease AddAB subunit AddA [Actinobacteria bacterium]|nr:helicase-exonuclease AddAB subunit AddA [Actinomycetota bacterium]
MRGNTGWTGEQWEAITERGCNLLVAAAAGAGKTAVLVERIIRQITDPDNPVDIDRLLIVTFTNAAAAEMRERIAEAIAAVLEKNPGSKNIQRQLTLLNKASITTIHSFCLEVIRSNFQSINIDPDFRIADETEASLMKLEVLQELFEEQYEKEENQYFFELLECYGGNRDDQALQEMVLNLYSFIQSSPWPEKWLAGMTESFNAPEGLDFGKTPWGRVLLNSAMLELRGMKEMLTRAVDILRYALGLEKYLNVYQEDLSGLDALLKVCAEESGTKWDAVYGALQGLGFSRLPSAGKDADREKQEYVKKVRDDVKAGIRKIKEKTFPAGSAEILNDLKAMYPVMQCLAGLVSDFSERYAARKSKKSVVDFNDLEHFCLEILSAQDEHGDIRPSGAALGYRERYAEILVDEYQDSNLIQEIMISMVSRADTGKPNVFMVGDVKQSIYRFRQAKPELFLDKYNSYSAEKGNPYRKILLYRNFRSRQEVVEAVNFIFRQIMSASVGELDYNQIEALHPGAAFAENDREAAVAGGEAELHLIQTGGGDIIPEEEPAAEEQESGEEQPEDGEMPDSIQCEARLAAKRIRELMQPDEKGREFCVFDKVRKEYRKADYRDIVILLRTMRNWSGVFMEELALQGIPAFADTGAGFFKTSEVQVILSLLQIIDNPLQDIPLLSVLRSPIVFFTTDELAELRLADRKASLYNALETLAEGTESPASKKAASFLHDLQRWRDMSLYLATDQLLWQLYSETGYFGVVGAMPAGEQRQANLRILFERARQFEETSYKGLFNFINFVDKLKGSKGDLGSAKILGENDNVVRIMSIHKSKGLEFPVVILSGCGKKFNLQDMNKSILLHQELGLGPDVVDHRLRLSYPSAPKQAIREKIKAETLSEEMRILYVALTRAREKLIITGAVSDVPKAAAKWAKCAGVREEKLPAYEMLKGGRYLDWIGPALLRHKDCGALRESAGMDSRFRELLLEDPSAWGVRIWNKSDVLSGPSAKGHDESQFIQWLDGLETAGETNEYTEEIAGRLGWKYQYEKISKVPAKVSVTELKRRFDAELLEGTGAFSENLPALVKKPLFLEEKKGLSAAEAGTALHFVMQRLNYKQADIKAQIDEMVARALITEQQAQSVDPDKIRRFLESPLGVRLLASKSVYREVPFNMEIPCRELYRDMQDEACQRETLLLQGVIDCYFEEPGGIVLLDYKTDYAPAGRVEAIRERYRPQISYYTRALELLTGKKVKEKYIYLFWNGEVLEY